MSDHKLGQRPDLGLTVAVFAHITEYYGNFVRQPQMKKEEMIDVALVAEQVANIWIQHRAEYDETDKKFNEDILEDEAELNETITDLLEQKTALEALLELRKEDVEEEVVVKTSKKAKSSEKESK